MRVDKKFLLTRVQKIKYDPSKIDGVRLDGSNLDLSAIKSIGIT